jgi:hypothetical protein
MTEKLYSEFEKLLETGSFHSYEGICRHLHVCPDDLDEALMKDLGYTGQQVFDEYFGIRCKNY